MRDGKALTNIDEFGGKSYKAGDKIPAAVLANCTPQVLKSLVDNYKIEVTGMEPSGGTGSGGLAHMTERLIALEGGKSAAAPKAAKRVPTSRRAATAAKAKE